MEKINCDIVAVIHRIFVDGERKNGGADKILDFLSKKSNRILMIEHPLLGLKEKEKNINEVVVSLITDGNIKEIYREKIKKKNVCLRWISEVFFNVNFINKNIKNKPIFFSSDPLNSLTGVFSSWKYSKKYFHFVDFSKRRFDIFWLNLIYLVSIKLSIYFFDLLGVVSIATGNELRKMGAKEEKIFYIPNSPVFQKKNLSRKEPFTLICTGGRILEKYNYEAILEIVYKLKKIFPKILLYAAGGTDADRQYYEKLLGIIRKKSLGKNVVFTGFLNSDELEKILIKATVGFSFYSKQVDYYMKYADPLKVREYALYGIVTISDGKSSVDNEMLKESSGYIVSKTSEAVNIIKKLIQDKNLYLKYQYNSINWAKKMDKRIILEKLYNKLFNEIKL